MKKKNLQEKESEIKETQDTEPKSASLKKCSICQEINSKYKCPQCYVKYCSVKCYKEHKERCMIVEDSQSAHKDAICLKTQTSALSECTSIGEKIVEETEDRVPVEFLQKLERSTEILTMLDNPHLRAMMENLCNSEDSAKDVAMAMQEPIFTEFADKCLNIVDIDRA